MEAVSLRLFQAAVSLVALAAVVWWATRQERPDLPATATGGALVALALALDAAATLARGERWHRILERAGVETSRGETYRLTTVGYMGNNVLPARAGDALRLLLVAPRAETDARTAIGTIVAERVLDVVVLVGLFVVLAYGVLGGIDVPDAGRLVVAALLLGAVAAVAATAALVLQRRGQLARVIAFLAPMAEATRRLRGNHGRELLAWTLLVWALEWVSWWLTAKAVGLEIGMLDAGYLLGLASIFVLIPSGPGYAGTFDAAIVFGVGALGASGAQALSYLLALRFVVTVPITLLGLVVLVARYGRLGRILGMARA